MITEKSPGLIGTIVDKSHATKTLNQFIPAYPEDSYMVKTVFNKNKPKNKRYRKKLRCRIRDFFKCIFKIKHNEKFHKLPLVTFEAVSDTETKAIIVRDGKTYIARVLHASPSDIEEFKKSREKFLKKEGIMIDKS